MYTVCRFAGLFWQFIGKAVVKLDTWTIKRLKSSFGSLDSYKKYNKKLLHNKDDQRPVEV